MKTVSIVGAGAIGTFLGAYLARSGSEGSALARGATAAALRTHGVRFEEGGTGLTPPVRVGEETTALGRQDLVVGAVKGPALPGLAPQIRPLLGPATVVLPPVNGG